MGRARQFDEGTILAAVMHLFWEKGYAATSIQDLEKITGLKRTSLYNTFGNKRSLFQKSLLLYRDQVEEMMATVISEAESCRQAVSNWLQAVIDMHFSSDSPGGCLLILSVLESSQHDAETKEMAAAIFHKEKEVLAERLAQGVSAGELRSDLDCQAVAGAIAAGTSGIMVLAMAGYGRPALEEIGRTTLSLLDQ